MMIFLVIVMTIGDMDFERRVPMLDAATCWTRAAETFEQIKRQHPEATGLGVGCTFSRGDPA